MHSSPRSSASVTVLADHRPEPADMTPDVGVGAYVVHAARKSPESTRRLDYLVWIEGPGRDPDDFVDVRRHARGAEPPRMTGLPDASGQSAQEMTAAFSGFARRAETLAGYGQDKPPEVRFNPAWVLWRKTAIMAMAESYGLHDEPEPVTSMAPC
jgi:hypothetical protein